MEEKSNGLGAWRGASGRDEEEKITSLVRTVL